MEKAINKKNDKVKFAFWLAIGSSIIFTTAIWVLSPLLADVPHLPDQGAAWYYWKLPNPEFWSGLTAWLGYGLHQISMWVIIYFAKKEKPHPNTLSSLNIAAIIVNVFFILAHLAQTHFFYDGLAQYVPVWTSQFSVIIMLIMVLILMIPKRGLFFGKKIKVPDSVYQFVKKYHSVYISWALIYTFWFHPMEGDFGILAGFIYMFFLFTQMSFFNTKIHFNIPWISFLEFFVGIHGPLIAIMLGQEAWPMFVFGFLFLTVFTQIHGLKLPFWGKILAFVLYGAGIAAAYYFRGYNRLFEISFIPVALYGGVFILGFVVWLGSKIKNVFQKG